MNVKLLSIALAGASLVGMASSSFAADDSAGGFFVSGNAGKSSLSKGVYDDTDTGYGLNAGYRWSINSNFALGLEGGFTDLGKFGSKSSYQGLDVGQASVKGYTAGVDAHFNLTPEWYLSARGGLFHADTKAAAFDSTGSLARFDDSSNKFYAGAGFGYDFGNRFSVGLNYDYFKTDTNALKLDPNLVSVSAEYRF